MISRINIRDFAIIQETDVEIPPGLSVITGETGAGKSIVIEAVSLALGSRASGTPVRAGKSKAVIQIVAETRDETGAPAEVVLTREIGAGGKSLAKIDGEIVPVARLAAFSAGLADIHGQYDHQSLLRAENHIALLDASDARRTTPARAAVSAAWRAYSDAARRRDALLKNEADLTRRLDFMRFEFDEIDKAAPSPGEDEKLRERLNVLRNGEQIDTALRTAWASLCDESPSAQDRLGEAMRALRDVSALSRELTDVEQRVSDAYYALEDVSATLRACRDRVEFSPEAINETVSRLDLIERLCAKYGGSVEKALAYRSRLRTELDDAENFDARRDELTARVAECEAELTTRCRELGALRKTAAANLEARVNAELESLNFSGARFSVSFDAPSGATPALSENGSDRVEFLISSNRGQPFLPLAKIASGGEMSRMMLAFKTVLGDYDDIPTMIFDEIDSGVSGVTASVVGRKLADMAKRRQVICITHLPQIAACGDRHFMIVKSSDDETTYTTLRPVEGEERAREIARLLGGANVTDKTLASARELIALSARPE